MTKRTQFLKLATLSACFTALASCGPTPLGPEAENVGLRGNVSSEPLVENGPNVNKVTISAAQLEEGKTYKLSSGILVINGNVPKGTQIEVESGRLIINGSVGREASVSAYMPEKMRQQKGICGLYNTSCNRTVRESLLYPNDTTLGIQIFGTLSAEASATSNSGILATCAENTARVTDDSPNWKTPISLGQIGNCTAPKR